MQAAGPDPARATILAILRQLNQADSAHEGRRMEQSLELGEIENRLADFWAVKQGTVPVALALGLLLRNGLVSVPGGADFSWQRQRTVAERFQITAEGKKFLVDAIETADRIP
ncbi:MAG: hypothetical protein L3K19_05620 [Thermoplasmata archaeon]|nr:hypothetical protein [Thermoplasmata archaeon]